jgi:hypothetical protein
MSGGPSTISIALAHASCCFDQRGMASDAPSLYRRYFHRNPAASARWIRAAAAARPLSQLLRSDGSRTTLPSSLATSVAGTPQYSPSASSATRAGAGKPARIACWRLIPSRTATYGSAFTHFLSTKRRRTRLRLPLGPSTSSAWSSEDVAPGRTETETTRAPAAPSIQRREFSESTFTPSGARSFRTSHWIASTRGRRESRRTRIRDRRSA